MIEMETETVHLWPNSTVSVRHGQDTSRAEQWNSEDTFWRRGRLWGYVDMN